MSDSLQPQRLQHTRLLFLSPSPRIFSDSCPLNQCQTSNDKEWSWACLVAWWQRICLPMQETQVQSPVQEDPTCPRATERPTIEAVLERLGDTEHGDTEPTGHDYRACAPQSPCSATREATAARSLHTEIESSPHTQKLEESPCSGKDLAQPGGEKEWS